MLGLFRVSLNTSLGRDHEIAWAGSSARLAGRYWSFRPRSTRLIMNQSETVGSRTGFGSGSTEFKSPPAHHKRNPTLITVQRVLAMLVPSSSNAFSKLWSGVISNSKLDFDNRLATVL